MKYYCLVTPVVIFCFFIEKLNSKISWGIVTIRWLESSQESGIHINFIDLRSLLNHLTTCVIINITTSVVIITGHYIINNS